MQKIKCPTCGSETAPDAACPSCGQAASNAATTRPEPTPPLEVARWNIEHASPDVLAWARQTFDEAEFLRALRDVERGGGVQIDDLIAEIERKLNGTV